MIGLEIFGLLMSGFGTALSLDNLFAALIGALLGIVVGALPGLGSVTGVALLLPLTFKMDPITGIIMLAALYYGCMYGGSFSAILLNIPGDSPAVMTAIDGNALTKKGKAGKALYASNLSSFIGGTIGIISLTFIGPWLANIGLAFGPAEIFAIILLALCSIGWLLGDSPTKGIVTTFLGVLLATVGVDAAMGQSRFTFGSINLLSGISFIPLVIGMFGFAQVMEMMTQKLDVKELKTKLSFKDSLLDKREMKGIVGPSVRSGLLGNFLGILPGAGATTGAFLCYVLEKRVGKDRAAMGKGSLSGVAAAESGNNAAAVGSFGPLLALGIPGSGTSAILLGGLIMWGLKPGPLLFTDSPDFVWGLISSMYVGNVISLLASLLIIPLLVKMLKIPTAVMIPVVAVLCIIGAYSVNNNIFDVWFMLFAGLVAFFLNIHQYPVAPLLLAFVLAPRLEMSVRQSLDLSNGDPSIFFKSPISAAILSIVVLICVSPLIGRLLRKKKAADKESEVAS